MSALDVLKGPDREQSHPADQPRWIEPMLATLTEDYFSDNGWIFERKLDGERVLAFRSDDGVRLRSRSRQDLTATYPEVTDALAADQPGGSAFVLDGEVVAFDGSTTSFSRLQGRMQVHASDRARASGITVYYYVFDVLHLDGTDLTEVALRRRKALLRRLLSWQDPLRFTPHRNAAGEAYRAEACRKGWEGVIAKRADAPYLAGRSTDWLKFKCAHGQELVIGGYTEPGGGRHDFGALLLGYHDGAHFVYAGKVGTGFDTPTLRDLGARLRSRACDEPPFTRGAPPTAGVHWVRPELVCEVAFTEWTRAGRLRHPRYRGLRTDKDAADVVREAARSIT